MFLTAIFLILIIRSKKDGYMIFQKSTPPKYNPKINSMYDRIRLPELPLLNKYNKQMQNCIDIMLCSTAHNPEACLNDCAVSAVMTTGFKGKYPPVARHVDPLTFDLRSNSTRVGLSV